jgi:hypothetical protein
MTYVAAVTSFVRQDLLAPGLATFLLVIMCYIAGRVHQFFKQTIEREQAYREGYNHATRSLFSLATQATSRRVLPTAQARPEVKIKPGYASVPHENRRPLPARHRAAGRRKTGLADTERIGLDQAA